MEGREIPPSKVGHEKAPPGCGTGAAGTDALRVPRVRLQGTGTMREPHAWSMGYCIRRKPQVLSRGLQHWKPRRESTGPVPPVGAQLRVLERTPPGPEPWPLAVLPDERWGRSGLLGPEVPLAYPGGPKYREGAWSEGSGGSRGGPEVPPGVEQLAGGVGPPTDGMLQEVSNAWKGEQRPVPGWQVRAPVGAW